MLAQHMPVGRVWSSSFDGSSNLGKLIRGLAVEYYRLELLIETGATQADIDKTDPLLEEWEQSVGLPDSCFAINLSITERRKQVLAKFSKFGGVQTSADFIRVAALFGIAIEQIIPGVEYGAFPLLFPATFFDDAESAAHTMFIQVKGNIEGDEFFPLPFPLPFTRGGLTFLQCIFNKLAPANVNVVITDASDL